MDGVTWRMYGETLDARLRDLQDRVQRGSYHPQPVRRVHIPKGDGRTRPLGITALEDKVVQLYWFGVNVTILGEGYRSRSKGKEGSCGRLVQLGTAKATHLASGLQPGIARRPDSGATAREAVRWGDVADRAV